MPALDCACVACHVTATRAEEDGWDVTEGAGIYSWLNIETLPTGGMKANATGVDHYHAHMQTYPDLEAIPASPCIVFFKKHVNTSSADLHLRTNAHKWDKSLSPALTVDPLISPNFVPNDCRVLYSKLCSTTGCP